MLNAPDFTPALRWFTGKSLEKAKAALEMLTASVQNGAWLPGHSRTVRATLSKANVISKSARKNEEAWDLFAVPADFTTDYYVEPRARRYHLEGEAKEAGQMSWSAHHNMYFGNFQAMQKINFDLLRKFATDASRQSLLVEAQQYTQDFASIADAVQRLDMTRPKPVFTSLGVSGTITDTFTDTRLDLDLTKVYYPEMVMKQVEVTNSKTGEKELKWVCEIIWPEGTVFNSSRFVGTEKNYSKCHSCGHAIKNGFNWVPVLINNKAGVPHCFWVGRDCARTIFGIDVTGDLEYTNANRG